MHLHATISVIFYGRYPELCRRFLTSLYRFTPKDRFTLRVGLNEACPETVDLVQSAAVEHGNLAIWSEARNVFKDPMMRRLLYDQSLETEWAIWFDDDSYPYRGDWLQSLALKIESEPEVDMWGGMHYTGADKTAEQFIRSAGWFRGLPFNYVTPKGELRDEPVLTFIAGGFWACRTRVLQKLDWPDRRLVINGDDCFFGEALRQNGYTIGRFTSGVRINTEPRRWPADTPVEYRMTTAESGASDKGSSLPSPTECRS